MAVSGRINDGDVWSGGVLAALGVYVVLEARQWDYLTPEGPGPGFFPMWYGIALVALSLLLIVGRLRQPRSELEEGVNWQEVSRALGVWLAFALSVALLKVLGFLMAYAALACFVVCVMYRRPLTTGLATGIGGAVLFQLVFPLALDVKLPVGIFGY